MKRAIGMVAVGIVLLACVASAEAQTKKVIRKSGGVLIGTVVEKDGVYEVQTSTGVIRVPADEVVSIEDYVSFEQEYAQRLLALGSGDVEGHYKLAQWCYRQGKLTEARDQLMAVLKLQPKHENAKLFMQLVDEEIIEKARQKREKAQKKTARRRPGQAMQAGNGDLVGQEDIYRVRLAELRSNDKVAISFRNRADRRFVEAMRGKGPFIEPAYEREFLRKSPVAKAVDMLDLMPDAKDLHADIRVKRNGQFMTVFRRDVWPLVARHCASSKCHGAPNGAGRLKLYNLKVKDDPMYFTNFLILDAFENSEGRMIDRTHPMRSLLLQYGLPTDISATPHPVEIRQVFRDADRDRQFSKVANWIRNNLLRPHPEYDLDYRIPGARGKKPLFESAGETPRPARVSGPACSGDGSASGEVVATCLERQAGAPAE